MYVLCTAVNVVYRCNCCVLTFCNQLGSYHYVAYATVSVLCIVQYFLYILCIAVLYPLTSVPPTTYPDNTCTTTGCATTVGWLLIMTTVGKTHAVKYTKEATLTKPIHC